MKVSIEVPETFTIATRDGASVEVATAKIAPDLLAALFGYGVNQKVRDARSTAKTQDESVSLMSACVDKLYAGDWSQRGMGGEAVDPFTRHARIIVRQLMKASADKAAWATFTGLSDADQLAKIDANVEANREAITEAVEERIAKEQAARQTQAKLGKKVAIEL